MSKTRYYWLAILGLAWFLVTPSSLWPVTFLLIVNLYAIWAERRGRWRGAKLWIA